MAKERHELRLGEGAAFDKNRLKRLPRSDDAWEADFEALPKPMMQTVTSYLGMVVTKQHGSLVGEIPVHGKPSVNDLATLLAHAMSRPLVGNARRPKLVYLRGHHHWRELFPVLNDIGVEVTIERKLTGIKKAYRDHLRRLREEQRAGMVKPSPDQSMVETIFPAVARYVKGYGYVEIGDQQGFGFVVRAIGYGGLDFEDDNPDTLAEAMAALEAGLVRWFEEVQGVKIP
jgi:hypothetical protein